MMKSTELGLFKGLSYLAEICGTDEVVCILNGGGLGCGDKDAQVGQDEKV